ncbi:hypothetical protein BC628DRAFT_1009334 [Trametes gibbosa]|nr:hypothetical protein BC628DRAFT_1009334 [Trametes gibbosa]
MKFIDISAGGTSLDSLPPELFHEILMLVPQQTILHFAFTCRKNYDLCQPALHHRVVLTHTNLASFHEFKIFRDDPALRWVKELKLGRHGQGDGWDVLSGGSILTTFPNLRLLDTLGHTPMRGWAGVLHVINTLPATVLDLSGNVYLTGDSHLWPSDCTFSSYKRIHLAFRIEHPALGFLPGYMTISRAFSASFPQLVNLSMEFQCSFDLSPIREFLQTTHFDNLKSFRLFIPTPVLVFVNVNLEDGRAMLSFLTRHATTLREVFIPYWILPVEMVPLLSHFPFMTHDYWRSAHVF